ncbi:protein kinase [Dactylosporangium sp. NPDC051541]|uniref:protein kinase domain-containing protein n=1 Tax=Dactylosporangium sp. NPDC051541 TaxID=3363977 RepID=UPI003798D584
MTDEAPRTSLDAVARTFLDAVPHTTRDAAPSTTRDAVVPGPRYQRLNLPPALAARFEVDRELGSGGEADVLLAADQHSGDQRVIRLYRRQDLPLDREKLDRLCAADPQHLIRLYEYGTGDGFSWEILEYAARGSLEDVRRRTPGPWTPAAVLPVFDQLRAAIAYANSMGMVHRDIKPANILIRAEQPLDLVLADFGLTKFLTGTRQMGTTSRTVAYAPPEAVSGEASRSVDWWSFGMTLVELLAGLHPFQRPDGTWQDDAMIVRELTTHDIDLDAVTDPRWRLLCRGLLTRAPERRWGAGETAEWRRGGSPSVAAPLPVPLAAARRPGGSTYVFAGVGYDDPRALAVALRGNWNEGRRLMAGRAVRAPHYLTFRDWLARLDLHDAVRALDGGVAERPERGLAQVLLALDPDSVPEYNGSRLDRAGLHRLVGDAVLNPGSNARGIVDVLFADGILTICDGAPGCDGYALLDDAWHRAVEQTEARLHGLHVPISAADRQSMHAQLLAAAFGGQWSLFLAPAQRAVQDQAAVQQPWFRAMAQELGRQPDNVALHTAILLTQPRAAQQTAVQQAEAQRLQVLAEQQRVRQRRANRDNTSAWLGLLFGLLGLIPYLGLVTGPFALYFGVRGRRSANPGAAGWALALGALTMLFSLCCWGSILGPLLTSPAPSPTP